MIFAKAGLTMTVGIEAGLKNAGPRTAITAPPQKSCGPVARNA